MLSNPAIPCCARLLQAIRRNGLLSGIWKLLVYRCFFQRSSRIIVCPLCQSVFVESAVPLAARHVKNLAKVYVRPNLDPLWLQISFEGIPKRNRCCLKVTLLKVDFSDPEQ